MSPLLQAHREAHASLKLSTPSFSGKSGGARKGDGDVFIGFMKPEWILRHPAAIPSHIDCLEVEFSLIAIKNVPLDITEAEMPQYFKLGIALELLDKSTPKPKTIEGVIKARGRCQGALILMEELSQEEFVQEPTLSLRQKGGEILTSGTTAYLKNESPYHIGWEMLQILQAAELTDHLPAGDLFLTGAIAGPLSLSGLDQASLQVSSSVTGGPEKVFDLTFAGT